MRVYMKKMVSLQEITQVAKKTKIIALDLETESDDKDSIDPEKVKIVWYSFAAKNFAGAFRPTHDVVKQVHKWLNDPQMTIVVHNATFDILALDYAGLMDVYNPVCNIEDTIVTSWLIDENPPHGLKQLVKKYFKVKMRTYVDVFGAEYNSDIERYNSEIEYASDDAYYTLKLFHATKKIIKDMGLLEWYEIEKVARVESLKMMRTGMVVHRPTLVDQLKRLKAIQIMSRALIYNYAKREFNPSSDVQLGAVLWHELQIPIPPKVAMTARGPSTAVKVIERIEHPIAPLILTYRSTAKLIGTYVRKFIAVCQKGEYGTIKCKFNTVRAVTGRWGSSKPNLENIPSRGDEGKKVREAFVARSGTVLIDVDLSQIELRIQAHITNDTNMIAVYKQAVIENGITFYTGDIHENTRVKISHVVGHDIPRVQAKACNFSLGYGAGAEKFAIINNIRKQKKNKKKQVIMDAKGNPVLSARYDLDTAKALRDAHYHVYKGLLRRHKKLQQAYNEGQREFPLMSGRARHVRDNAYGGKIFNSEVQGAAADYMKIHLWLFHKYLFPLKELEGLRLINQVHDEFVFECPTEIAEVAAKLIKYIMELPVFPLKVPVLASAKICQKWSDKDNDAVPEVGVMDSAEQSSVAMLTPEDIAFCKKIVPVQCPIFGGKKENKKRLSIEEYRKWKEAQ